MPPQNIKSFIEIQLLDQITNFREADGERIVRSFCFTSELGRLASKLIEAIATPNSSGAARIISGPVGGGRSHLLHLVQTLATTPRTRLLVNANPQVANACRRLESMSYIPVLLSGDRFTAGTPDIGGALREALRTAHDTPLDFDDSQWYLAIEHDQICELVCSKLFPGMGVLLCIDNISEIFRSGRREAITTTLRWLSLFATKSRELPIAVLLVLDADVLDPHAGAAAKLAGEYQVDHLTVDNLRRITDQAVFRKSPGQRAEVTKLYREVLTVLPRFHWGEQEFVEVYPIHPAVFDVAPGLSAYCESFSLFGFMTTSAGRALGRRALQLVSLDELFDRFEFDLRKDQRLQRSLEVYDFLTTIVIPGLPIEDRFKAKLLLKGLYLYALVDRPVSAYDLTNTLMLYEESSPDLGYDHVATILKKLEQQAEGQLIVQVDGIERRYSITVVERYDPETRLKTAAAEISDTDERLTALLVTLGGTCFSDWPFSVDALLMSSLTQQRTEMQLTWRGTLRRGIVSFLSPLELVPIAPVQIEKHLEKTDSSPDSQPGTGRATTPTTGLPEFGTGEVRVTYTYSWDDDCCELDWQIVILPHSDSPLPTSYPHLSTLLFLKPAQLSPQDLLVLKKTWILYTKGDEVLGMEATEKLQQLEAQVRDLFLKAYLKEGTFQAATGESFPARKFWSDSVTNRRFTDFTSLIVQPALDKRYPAHPIFKSVISEREVRRIVLGLLGGLNPHDPNVQEFAAQFAVPLNLVTNREGIWQLAVDRDEALSQSFISEILRLVEASTANDPVPVQVIYHTLRREPYGLLEPTQQLILMSLIAGWRVELIDVSGIRVFGAAELTQDVSFRQYGTVRRTATINYSAEVLTEWCRLLTERPDLTELTVSQGRKQCREALADWAENWERFNLLDRFDKLPIEMLTTRTWQLIITCKRYFEATSRAVSAVLHERISLEMGLARIVEVFSANPTIYHKAQHELRLLVAFLDWLPYYIASKDYSLSAASVKDDSVMALRRELTDFFSHPHRLLDEDKRRRFETVFQEFKDAFIRVYCQKHEDSVSGDPNRATLNQFLAGDLWRTFELFSQLSIANTRYLALARELIDSIEHSFCDLPVRDILELQPHCLCGFRVERVTLFATMLDNLKTLARAGVDYHRRLLIQYRAKLSQHLRSQTINGHLKEHVGAVLAFISNSDAAAGMSLTPGMLELINECLREDTRALPASPPAPFILGEHLSKQDLKTKLNAWIDALPDDPGFAFEISEAPFSTE